MNSMAVGVAPFAADFLHPQVLKDVQVFNFYHLPHNRIFNSL